MKELIMYFFEHVWHRYWTVLDLFITFFILYQLRRVSITLKNLKSSEEVK